MKTCSDCRVARPPKGWSHRTSVGSRTAFTLLELLFVVLIVGILAALLLPAVEKGRTRARRIECISNLKQLGVAYHQFAHEHGDQFPFQVPVKEGGTLEFVKAAGSVKGEFFFAYRHFQALSNDLGATRPLVCPADQRTNATTFDVLLNHNISYFAGATATYLKPESLLSGDRNISDGIDAGSLLRLTTNTPAAWTSGCHQFKGNLLFADSHVEGVGSGGLVAAVYNSGLPVNTLFPPIVPPDGVYPGASPPTAGGWFSSQPFFQIPANENRSPSVPAPAGAPIPRAATPPVAGGPETARAGGDPVRPKPAAPMVLGGVNLTNAVAAAVPGAVIPETNAVMTSSAPARPDSLLEPKEPAPTSVFIFIIQPERCWPCWIVAMIVAVISAFFIGRSVARRRRADRQDAPRLEELRVEGDGARR